MHKKPPNFKAPWARTLPPHPRPCYTPLVCFWGCFVQKIPRQWGRWIVVGVIVVVLTVITLGHEGDAQGPKVRLVPFEEYVEATTCMLQGCEHARRWLLFVLVDGVGNLVVFMPLGAALDYALKDRVPVQGRRLGTIALLGASISIGYEIIQLWIPGRVTAVDDVVINTTGTALGAAFAMGISSVWRQQAPRTSLPGIHAPGQETQSEDEINKP
jgi:glycopeptide antibiotics resistance protein